MSDSQVLKKRVAAKLTQALEKSSLAGRIDSKSFFMMIETSFGTMHRDDSLDLTPLWGAFSSAGDPVIVSGLFLRFAQEIEGLGSQAILPPDVARLNASERQVALDASGPTRAVRSASSIGDQKGQIIFGLVQTLRVCPAAKKVSTGQLQGVVATQFDKLFDGQTFDYAPVLDWLLSQPGVTEEDCYLGIVEFRRLGAEKGFKVKEPPMKLDERTRKKIEADAAPKVPHAPSASPEKPAVGHGFEAPAKQKSSKGPVVLMALALVGLLAFGAVFVWGAGTLSVQDYAAVFPLVRAQKIDGIFVGVVDEKKWETMDEKARLDATKKLEDMMRTSGLLRNGVVIRTEKGTIVVFDRKGESLDVATQLTPEQLSERKRAAPGVRAPQ